MQAIGERIRVEREKAVLSQGELAEAAGLSRNGVWQIEHGRKQPRPATIRKIAEALKIEPSELVRGAND
jgi:transcriptional regulator with XRE-family HTH domain